MYSHTVIVQSTEQARVKGWANVITTAANPSAELERTRSSVPPSGGKDAEFKDNESKDDLQLAPEKKPNPAHLSKVKSLMMVLLLLMT